MCVFVCLMMTLVVGEGRENNINGGSGRNGLVIDKESDCGDGFSRFELKINLMSKVMPLTQAGKTWSIQEKKMQG